MEKYACCHLSLHYVAYSCAEALRAACNTKGVLDRLLLAHVCSHDHQVFKRPTFLTWLVARGQAFLRRLLRAGQRRDVVFLDMDALVVAPLAPAFTGASGGPALPFDLALTLSDAVDMCALHGPVCALLRVG